MPDAFQKFTLQKLDPNVLRFNQLCIMTSIVLAALLRQPWIVTIVAAIMLLGTFNPKQALFKNAYVKLVQPVFKIPVTPINDDPRAHNFAQAIGGIFLSMATLAFLVGWTALGWLLAAIVVALAGLSFSTGICVGCFMYFQFRLLQHRLRYHSARI